MLVAKMFRLIVRGRVNYRLLVIQMAQLGVNSIPISCLVMAFVGASLTYILAGEFVKRGAGWAVGAMLLLVLLREMIPVLTSVVMAGFVGASITSEIGSMEITEQIDALKALSTDPDWYLTLPRMLGVVLMMPIIGAFAGYAAFFSGYLMAHTRTGLNYPLFMFAVPKFVEFSDYRACLIKLVIFGATVALVGCYYGFNTKGGAAGVGRAVTASVVTSIVLIFALDLILMPVLFTK